MPPKTHNAPDTAPDPLLEVLAYLVTSAELCTKEPLHYGMFRLIDGASRLAGALLESGRNESWIRDLKQEIDQNKEKVMWDRSGFEELLREASDRVATGLKTSYKSL